MICKPCRGGSHEGCPGTTHCDCQHRQPKENGNGGKNRTDAT